MDENKGFIKLDRSLLEWEWYDSISMRVLWLHILLTCNYKDKKWHGFDVPAGSFITSVSHLSEEVGLSRNTVIKCLDLLEKTGEIKKDIQPNRFTKITINNWKKYQAKERSVVQKTYNHLNNEVDNPMDNPVDNSMDNPMDTTKEGKKERKEEVKNASSINPVDVLLGKTPEEIERDKHVAQMTKEWFGEGNK